MFLYVCVCRCMIPKILLNVPIYSHVQLCNVDLKKGTKLYVNMTLSRTVLHVEDEVRDKMQKKKSFCYYYHGYGCCYNH